jgi:hypothetical protein
VAYYLPSHSVIDLSLQSRPITARFYLKNNKLKIVFARDGGKNFTFLRQDKAVGHSQD